MDPNPDEAAIAEFHRAARRRNVRIYAIAALALLVIGLAVLVVSITAGESESEQTTYNMSIHERRRIERDESKGIIYGIAFVVAGFVAAGNAVRIARGGEMR